jgi:hypothetical protein
VLHLARLQLTDKRLTTLERLARDKHFKNYGQKKFYNIVISGTNVIKLLGSVIYDSVFNTQHTFSSLYL